MQNTEREVSQPLKSLLFAGAGLASFFIGLAIFYFGISDGSLIFIAPILLGPFMCILGITYGINSVRKNINPRSLAIAGIVIGCISLLIIIATIVFISMLVSGLSGVY